QIAFAVEDYHRDLLPGVRRTDAARQILRDDVAQQCGLSGSGLADNDSLHDADPVRPKRPFAQSVVSENDGLLRPRFFDRVPVPGTRDGDGFPGFFLPPPPGEEVPRHQIGETEGQQTVSGDLQNLPHRKVPPRRRYIYKDKQPAAPDAEEEQVRLPEQRRTNQTVVSVGVTVIHGFHLKLNAAQTAIMSRTNPKEMRISG